MSAFIPSIPQSELLLSLIIIILNNNLKILSLSSSTDVQEFCLERRAWLELTELYTTS